VHLRVQMDVQDYSFLFVFLSAARNPDTEAVFERAADVMRGALARSSFFFLFFPLCA